MKNKKFVSVILGGTFDPPHEGHLYISNLIIKKFKFKTCIWAINYRNPFKQKKPKFSSKQRISKCKRLIKNNRKIKIGNFKYANTYNLIKKIKVNSQEKVFFIIGSDNLTNLHKWFKFKKIMEELNFIIVERPGYRNTLKRSNFFKQYSKFQIKGKVKAESFAQKSWFYCKTKGVNISSSNLRNSL